MYVAGGIMAILAYNYGTALATLPLSALPPASLDETLMLDGAPIQITGRHPEEL